MHKKNRRNSVQYFLHAKFDTFQLCFSHTVNCVKKNCKFVTDNDKLAVLRINKGSYGIYMVIMYFPALLLLPSAKMDGNSESGSVLYTMEDTSSLPLSMSLIAAGKV